ncbi:hypothetical protein C4565_06035 [Candidatus Parcubacteria bacterium]|nr:MAG: hypothetical protein C4565_06035 [Candidatus Parcubacteria bacterium]
MMANKVLIDTTHSCYGIKTTSNHWNSEIRAPFKKVMALDALFFILGIGVGLGIGAHDNNLNTPFLLKYFKSKNLE